MSGQVKAGRLGNAPLSVEKALSDAAHALSALSLDASLSGMRARQRTLTRKAREALDLVDWVIDYECSEVAA